MNIWKSKYRVDGVRASSRRVLRGNVSARRGGGAERATIICAVIVAAALGGASGLWLSAQWASAAASADATAPADATAARAERNETQPPPLEAGSIQTGVIEPNASDGSTASADNALPKPTSPDSAEPSPVGTRTHSSRKTEDDKDDAKANAVVNVRTNGREKRPEEEVEREHAGRTGEPRSAFARAQGGPCRLSMNAGALAMRGGGSATVTLSLGGAGGAVAASTPDWSNIVVLSESGPFGNEAQRFLIRSVSGRPGTYSVSFRSPCGSRTIPVTVTGTQR
jgi:hypothetical protein